MKKRFLALLLCAAVALSVCACGESNAENTEAGNAQTIGQPSIVELASYDDLSVVLSGDYEITDEYINAYFSNVLYNAGAGIMKVTDRDTVQAGDIVKVDYTGYLDGVAFSGGAATNQWIDVSNNCGINTASGTSTGGYIDGFTDGLIGAKIGEKTSSEVTFPEAYSNTDLAGKLTTFEFTVHEIYVVVTPENITDEYVVEHLSKTYEVSTVDEFIAFVKEELAYNFTIDYLIEKSQFDIPESYLNARLESYEAYFEYMYCQGMTIEDYLAYYVGITIDAARAEWAEALKAQIKAELVFEAMVENGSLELDEEAHNAYLQNIISVNSAYFPDEESIYKYAGAGDAEAGEVYMKNQAAVREYLIENYNALSAE